MTPIIYKISPTHPETHYFDVEIQLGQAHQHQVFSLPAWIPGSYMIRDFARHIVAIRCFNSKDEELTLSKRDKQTWQANNEAGETLTLVYRVYAFDTSVRAAYLDDKRGFFNGTSVFLQAQDHTARECELSIIPPQSERYDNWRVATGLTPLVHTEDFEFGRYRAKDYDELIDCPVELGEFELAEFAVNQVPHYLVISGNHKGDIARLAQDLQPLCQHHADMFGELPFERYLFQLNLVKNGFGGLEHQNSTALIASRADMPMATQSKISDGYRTLLSLCSHEYFHAWNVKRMKPAAFVPYQLDKESYTQQLWIYEGFTSYFDDLSLVHTGLISHKSYLELVAKQFTRFAAGQGPQLQTVTASSFDAWTRFYQQDENAPNAIVSYYNKGALIALCLDLLIKQQTDHREGLNTVMQQMWHHYQRTGQGTQEEEVYDLICGRYPELAAFLTQALYSTADLPFADILYQHGVRLTLRQATKSGETGGNKDESPNLPDFGARFADAPLGIRITQVLNNRPAELAGLSKGDIVVALDQEQVSSANFDTLLASYREGEQANLHYFRDGRLWQTEITLNAAPANIAYLEIVNQEKAELWLTSDCDNKDDKS